MKFQLLKSKLLKKRLLISKLSDVVFIMLINVKMPIIGTFTFMSMVNFMLGWADHDLEPGSIQESSRFILDWAVKHQLKQTLSILMKTVHVFGLCKQLTTCGTCV